MYHTAFLGMPSVFTLPHHLHENMPEGHFNTFGTTVEAVGVDTNHSFELAWCFSVSYHMDQFLLCITVNW